MPFELLLMRHGHAEDYAAGGDSERRLTDRGQRDVQGMARLLSSMELDWGAAASSPFVRARQTLELLHDEEASELVELVPGGHPDEAIAALVRTAQTKGVERLLAVGHNPNITSMLGRLVVGDPGVYFSVGTSDVAHLWIDTGGVRPSGAVLGFYPARRLAGLA